MLGLKEIITGNYEEKLSQEIMRRNHHRKLSASIYHHAKNVDQFINECFMKNFLRFQERQMTFCDLQ